MAAADEQDEEADGANRSHSTVAVVLHYVLPVFIVLFFLLLVVLFCGIGPTRMVRWLLTVMPKDPNAGHAVFLGMATILSIVLCLPLWPPLMIIIGMIFGFWRGLLVSFCAMVLGALISFFLGRFACMPSFRSFIERSDYQQVRRMMLVVEEEQNAIKFLFLFRFLLLPIWVRNYVPALLHVSIWVFILPVLVHAAWIASAFSWVGTTTKSVAEAIAHGDTAWGKLDPTQLTIFALATISMILVSYLAYREYSKKLAQEAAPLTGDEAKEPA